MRGRPTITRFETGVFLLIFLSIAFQAPTLFNFYNAYQDCVPNQYCSADYGMTYFIGFRLLELQTILVLFVPVFILLELLRWNRLWQYLIAGVFLGPASYYTVYYKEMIEGLIKDGENFWINDAISDDLANGIITGVIACVLF